MTLPEIYERIGALPNGGYLTSDSRFDRGQIYSLVHSARAVVVADRWAKERKIPPIYYQTYFPAYNKLAQEDSCYIKFYDCPSIISLDGTATGVGYVGTINGVPTHFREVSSRAAFSSMQKDRIMKAGRKAYILFGHNGELEAYYKDAIKEFQIEIIASDPTQVPGYNIDIDTYPLDVADLPKIEQYLLQSDLALSYKTPIDRVNDGRDVTVAPFPRN